MLTEDTDETDDAGAARARSSPILVTLLSDNDEDMSPCSSSPFYFPSSPTAAPMLPEVCVTEHEEDLFQFQDLDTVRR